MKQYSLYLALCHFLVFALSGEHVLQAQTPGGVPIPDPSIPALNILRLDRLMAPGLTLGAESSLQQDRGYHMGYVQATIPLKGKLAIGLNLQEILDIKKPLDVLDVLKPDIRQRFLDVGLRSGSIQTLGFPGSALLDVYAGASGLRYVGNRGFLIWGMRGRFAETDRVFEEGYAIPRVGLRAQSALGYARFAKPGILWYAGAYLAYDDGMWVPLPWAGLQARHPRGHRFRVLLPREIQYRYRWGQKSFLHAARWEAGAQIQMRMDRFGVGVPGIISTDAVPSRFNTTLWESRVGAWIAHRIVGGRTWVQLHGGWVPCRRWSIAPAPGSEWTGNAITPPESPEVESEWVWDAFSAESLSRFNKVRPYIEIRFVADLGKDWLGLDLGRVLMPN